MCLSVCCRAVRRVLVINPLKLTVAFTNRVEIGFTLPSSTISGVHFDISTHRVLLCPATPKSCVSKIYFLLCHFAYNSELCAIIKKMYYYSLSSPIGIDSIRLLLQFGHCLMRMLFVAIADAHQKHDLHIRKKWVIEHAFFLYANKWWLMMHLMGQLMMIYLRHRKLCSEGIN